MNTIIDQIRSEIERLMKENSSSSGLEGRVLDLTYEDGINTALNDVLEILDTLQEQPVCEDVEMEIKETELEYQQRSERGEYPASIESIARHFYELGRQSKQKVCEELEEEIDRLWNSFADEVEGPHNIFDVYARLARHFAQWGAEHLRPADGKKWIYEDEYKKDLERLFNDGKQAMKEQMMKEAVEGEVVTTNKYTSVRYLSRYGTFRYFYGIGGGFQKGDKVKIIIVKED